MPHADQRHAVAMREISHVNAHEPGIGVIKAGVHFIGKQHLGEHEDAADHAHAGRLPA